MTMNSTSTFLFPLVFCLLTMLCGIARQAQARQTEPAVASRPKLHYTLRDYHETKTVSLKEVYQEIGGCFSLAWRWIGQNVKAVVFVLFWGGWLLAKWTDR